MRATPGGVFLAVGGLFGVFFALATPPHDPPDEARHHARAWLLAEGRLGVVGAAPGFEASVPREILHLHPPGHHWSEAQLRAGRLPPTLERTGPHEPAELLAALRGSLSRWDLQPVRYVASYPPLVYAPFVPALWLARALDLSAAAGLYLARLAGLACWLAGIWAALRVAPCQRWLLAATALLPISVFQGASLSGDPLTQLAVFWWLAELLRALSRGPEALARADVARLLAAALSLGLVKPGYAPLALASLALALPPARRLALGAGALAAAAVPALGWAAVLAAAEQVAIVSGADPAAQLRFALAHPLAFLAASGGTAAALLPAWLEGLVGYLGHFDVEIPAAATALGLAAVAASAALERGALTLRARLVLLATFLVTALALLAMSYLAWTPVGADRVFGVQGRYFLPALPFALFALPALPRVPERALSLAVVAALLLVLALSGAEMLRTYYAP
jgi:hypothetical protein